MSEASQFIGPNAGYMAELYERYRSDPASVGPDLRHFFETWSPDALAEGPRAPDRAVRAESPQRLLRLAALVQGIRDYGHAVAAIDPLGQPRRDEPMVRPETHGLTRADLREIPAAALQGGRGNGVSAEGLVHSLREAYCGTTGYDFSAVRSPEERAWLYQAVESGLFRARLDTARKRALLQRLTHVDVFENFLFKSFPGGKWFSLAGSDSLVPVLDEMVAEAADAGIRSLALGMAHRGRLNVMTHIFGKPYEAVMAVFLTADAAPVEDQEHTPGWVGDVKYHLGYHYVARVGEDKQIDLTLLPNPSHLELASPVVEGVVRAAQDRRGPGRDGAQDLAAGIAVLVHGDASFPGQGSVAETFNLSHLAGYWTGGVVHIIANNQVGFTTDPKDAVSTWYASDPARGYDVPVIHVNGDDMEACISAARLAFAYRQRFHKDVLIDLVGYRRFGHNEGDEPTYTQPAMYELIVNRPPLRVLWGDRLAREGVVAPDETARLAQGAWERLQRALAAASSGEVQPHAGRAAGAERAAGHGGPVLTAVRADLLSRLNEELHAFPSGFSLHPKLDRPFQRRREAFSKGGQVDWAHAEALAFASLLAEGVPVRLSGQDVERGTFTQRHAVLHDVRTNAVFTPLRALPSARAPFQVYNSPLSEVACLGFEYGYSVASPETLVLWEAQFGDFVNNAQSVIDEFIASAKAKWAQLSGLVLLLPHGYEGQGANHSYGHLARFLALCADDNLRVAYPTTAAQYFHLLRRQAGLLRVDPRPLVVMTAKSLLRHPLAASAARELTEGSFQAVIDDPRASVEPGQVRRVVLCAGKVVVDLLGSGGSAGTDDLAVVRVEELYPFPSERVAEVLARYPNAEQVAWLQEEPRNRGAWTYLAPLLQEVLPKDRRLAYVGRPAMAVAAEGSIGAHRAAQERIIREVLHGPGVQGASDRGVRYVR